MRAAVPESPVVEFPIFDNDGEQVGEWTPDDPDCGFGDATAEQTGRSQLGPPPANPWWFAPLVFVVLLGIMAGVLVASWAWS